MIMYFNTIMEKNIRGVKTIKNKVNIHYVNKIINIKK